MAETGESAGSEIQGIAKQIVSTLGLVDLLFGGLALYWWRLVDTDFTSRFPGTGSAGVDIALQVGGATLLGKLLSLGTSIIGDFVRFVMRRTWPGKHHYDESAKFLARLEGIAER